MMADISLQVSSQDSKDIYPNNQPHDFTINLTRHYSLEGQWKVGLRELSHSVNVVNLQDHGEPQTIVFHWLGEDGEAWGEQSICLPADASFLTPKDLITYINQSFTHLSRRPEPQVTTYRLEELVTLRAWSPPSRKRENAQALQDIPQIRIHRRFAKRRRRRGMMYMDVRLGTTGTETYFTKQVTAPEPDGGWTNDRVTETQYESFTCLPRRPFASDWKHLGTHKFFSLTDVAEVSHDPSTNKFKLFCRSNIERVFGVRISANHFLGEKLGLHDGTGNKHTHSVKVLRDNAIPFPYAQKLAKGYEALAVDCSLAQPCQVGDTSINLLAVVPVLANREKRNPDMNYFSHITYKNIEYAPLLHSSFGTIRIQFKKITGEDIKFASGTDETQVSLHLKRYE